MNNGGEGEGVDHTFALPDDALIAQCVSLNPKTIVSLISGSGAQMDWADKAAAIIFGCYGGQTAPDALIDILTGKVNPSGKLPFTIEKRFEDSCAVGNLTIPRPLSKPYDPVYLAQRIPKKFQWSFAKNQAGTELYAYDINYGEEDFAGYRWYKIRASSRDDSLFGFGLSAHTNFWYSDLNLSPSEFSQGGSLKVNVTVTNIGKRKGDEIVEIYVSELHPKVDRPKHRAQGLSTRDPRSRTKQDGRD